MNAMQEVGLPIRPRALPAAGRVELWLTDLSGFPLAQTLGGATVGDRVRALKLQQRFVLRLLLGGYLGCPGKDVRIVPGENDKPELGPEQAASGLRFNLSHSGNWLTIGVTRGQAIGVDIERTRVLRRSCALSRRFLSDAEARFICRMEEPERSARFLDLWARREALVKAMGSSLARSLTAIELEPATGQLLSVPAQWPAPSQWRIVVPELPGQVRGAVAVAGSELRVQTFVLDARLG